MERKIVGFKKFSELKKDFKEVEPTNQSPNDELPMNPNLPTETSKKETSIKDDKLEPTKHSDLEKELEETDEYPKLEKNVSTFGKVARFPKNVQASKAFAFMENIKISKKSIWYLMIEKQDSELQMVKYNYKEGVDLNKFVNELKTYYLHKFSKNKEICEKINNIEVDGNDKFSCIKSIPLIKINERTLISIITEDLIKLLS